MKKREEQTRGEKRREERRQKRGDERGEDRIKWSTDERKREQNGMEEARR